MNQPVTNLICAALLLIPLIVFITLLWRSRDEFYEHGTMPPIMVFMLVACIPLLTFFCAILATIATI